MNQLGLLRNDDFYFGEISVSPEREIFEIFPNFNFPIQTVLPTDNVQPVGNVEPVKKIPETGGETPRPKEEVIKTTSNNEPVFEVDTKVLMIAGIGLLGLIFLLKE